MGTHGAWKNSVCPPCQVWNRGEGGLETEETFQLLLLFAFQVENPALQGGVGNVPALRDAPGFEQ